MRRAAAAIALGVVVLAQAAEAEAVEREQHAGVDVGPGFFVSRNHTSTGASIAAHYTYGLTDEFDLTAEASWSLVSFTGGSDPTHTRPDWLASADVGAAYVLDVIRWVPYVGVLVGATTLSGGPLGRSKVLPDAAIAIGLDYRIDRSWVVGVAGRQRMLFTDASTYPSYTQVLARFEYTWGW
ncbi:MAG: hypothetical protein FWD17_19700 [Polyangiaceae bacterium]|nr:hypothetical protein [Polyangiaceae bacterium]